ncbi:MAG: GNAT family N-acetyltransferase [Trueperaceae bacterium]
MAIGRGAVNRMNATTTFGIAPPSFDGAVESVERLTRQHGAPARFRLTPLDERLDALLAQRGFARSADVAVMKLDLALAPMLDSMLDSMLDPSPDPSLDSSHDSSHDSSQERAPGASPAPHARVHAEGRVTEAWLERLRRFGGYDEARVREIGESLERLRLPYAVFWRVDAVGLAVRDGAWLGLFDIAVDPARRRSGAGRAITASMLTWGRDSGAERAYLQVHSQNAPALALYRRFGFTEAYQYHYRTAAHATPSATPDVARGTPG